MAELNPAPKGYPIKLVRDNTAAIINSTGEPGDLFYGKCPSERVVPELRKKLAEEVAEYLVDGTIEELADVLAVMDALAYYAHDYASPEDLRHLVETDRRGGFITAQMMYGRHEEFDK